MTDRRAASEQRLLGPAPWTISEPTWDWSRDWARIAARALELVANDPFAAAMVQCKLDSTHGPNGLTPVSLAQLDTSALVSKKDHDVRSVLERGWAQANGIGFDAGGLLTRKAFDRQLDWLATVMGEGFAVRMWKPGRLHTPFSTCWRLVRPERVNNPDGKPNGPCIIDGRAVDLYHGFELVDTSPVAIWVETTPMSAPGYYPTRTWERIAWFSDDGTANVVHRVGWREPGHLRGISMFAPMLLLARQLGGTIEAHVTAKRAQACNPVIYYVDNPEAAAKAARADASSVVGPHTKFNPLQVYYAKFGSQVQFTDTKFNGADLEAFLKIGFRVLTSVWQQPIEVVLCQMGESNLASSRASLDQVDRTADVWRGDHIEQAANPFEGATTAEMVKVTKQVKPGPSGLSGLALTRYRRPPKFSTDRLKDANTVEKLIEVGVSPTTALGLFGMDFEDEVDQSVRDELYRNDQRANAKLLPPSEDILRDAQASIALIAAGLSNWKIEVAKRGEQYGAVWEQALIERKEAADKGLVFDLSGSNAPAPDSTVGKKEEPAADNGKSPAGEESTSTDGDDAAKPATVANP